MEKNELNIYAEALDSYGIEAQKRMLVEECGELLSALGKLPRGRASVPDLITELVDVEIMVRQMAVYHGWEEFIKEKKRKLLRLDHRIQSKK